jgi:hypothetical protein
MSKGFLSVSVASSFSFVAKTALALASLAVAMQLQFYGFSVLKYCFMVSPAFVPVMYSIRELVSSEVFPRKLLKPFFLFDP